MNRFVWEESDFNEILKSDDIEKANPYHDELGRFTFAPAGAKTITTDSGNIISESEIERRSALWDKSLESEMLHSGYTELEPPTDDLGVAQQTGAPIAWLMPESLHPKLKVHYDNSVKDQSEEYPVGKIRMESLAKLNKELKTLGFTEEEAEIVADALDYRASKEASVIRAKRIKFIDQDKSQDEADSLPFGSRDDDHIVTVNAGESAVTSIFSEGRYKTQFETKSSGGTLNNRVRAKQEVASFSMHPFVNPEMRPVYGQVHPDGFTEELDMTAAQYGNIVLVLDKKVRERTTWTEGDSLMNVASHSSLTTPTFHGVSSYNQSRYYFSELDGGSDAGGYLEAQIHGGVKASDIKYVVLPAYNGVGESLWETLVDYGVPKEIIVSYDDALEGAVSKLVKRKLLKLPNNAILVASNSSSKLYSTGIVETERGLEHLGYVQHGDEEIYRINVDDVYSRGYWIPLEFEDESENEENIDDEESNQ